MSTREPVEVIGDGPVKAQIFYATDAEPPEDDIVKIAYSSSRYALGTQACTRDELDLIGKRIEKGELIGVPVWAYVHSGATISSGIKLKGKTNARLRENPFGCPWDSGRSGWAYMTREDALREWGNKKLGSAAKARAIAFIDAVVDEFALYLQGDVYDVHVVDESKPAARVIDSMCGIIGLDLAQQEAREMLEFYASA